MLGGYQIIDLRGISVTMGNDVSITDLNVLKQLLTLREYIEDNYNYTIPLNKRLKAVMIRLRDAKSGEKTEGCLWGNLSIIDDNLSFNIDAIVSVDPLKVLQIKVVFEKKQDDDGNDYYDIKTAKYEFRGGEDVVTVTDIKAIPSATINKLDFGDIVLKKDASGYHAYIISFKNATGICLTYTDAYCVETQSQHKVGQNWVYNSEDKTIIAQPLIENIVDTHGNKRFIEGDGTPISLEGITIKYSKWSLSGSHLMIVLAFDIANGTQITDGTMLFNLNDLPSWIKDKIYPTFSNIIALSNVNLYGNDWTTQTLLVSLLRTTQNSIILQKSGGTTFTATANRGFRVAFDLLIDNE